MAYAAYAAYVDDAFVGLRGFIPFCSPIIRPYGPAVFSCQSIFTLKGWFWQNALAARAARPHRKSGADNSAEQRLCIKGQRIYPQGKA